MNGFKTFHTYRKPVNIFVLFCQFRDFTDNIFNKHGIVICLLRDMLLIGSFQTPSDIQGSDQIEVAPPDFP